MSITGPAVYHIWVKGHLTATWSDWFEGLTITLTEEGETELSGPLADQAALFGVLNRLHNLGLTLLIVARTNQFSDQRKLP
jgi:hypothetical protein